MKMTMCKERLCSHTSAAPCHAGAASACAETTAQARTLSVKNTMLRMVFFSLSKNYQNPRICDIIITDGGL